MSAVYTDSIFWEDFKKYLGNSKYFTEQFITYGYVK